VNTLILTQIPLDELLAQVKQAVREELDALGSPGNTCDNTPPITQKELSAFLGITEQTVIRWKQKGKIPFFNIGSAIRFDLKEVLAALKK